MAPSDLIYIIEEANSTISDELVTDYCLVECNPTDFYLEDYSIRFVYNKIWVNLIVLMNVKKLTVEEVTKTVFKTIRGSDRYKAIKLETFLNSSE